MSVTAKVVPYSKFETGAGEHRQVAVTFNANYADGGNKEWSLHTPSLKFELTLKGAIADKFVIGQGYTVTFTEDPKPEAESVNAEASQ